MREAADAYGTPIHSQTSATDPSACGASEQEKNESLAHHRELLQKLRESTEKAPTCETEAGDALQSSSNEVGVEVLQVEDADWISMGPIELAKYLCEKGELTTERRGLVALVARDMQKAYDEEVARRAKLTDTQLRAEGIADKAHVTLPLKGRRLRVLLYG